MSKKRRSGSEIFFATWVDTQKVHDLEADPHCSLAFHAAENSATYVSVSGTVEIVRDRQTIHDLWEPDWKPWFPKGPDEGDIALLRFIPEHAEFPQAWTGPKPQEASPPPEAEAKVEAKKERTRRVDGAGLLRRRFAQDVFACSGCGGRRRVLASLRAPDGVHAIVEHQAWPSRPAGLAPAQGPPQSAGC